MLILVGSTYCDLLRHSRREQIDYFEDLPTSRASNTCCRGDFKAHRFVCLFVHRLFPCVSFSLKATVFTARC